MSAAILAFSFFSGLSGLVYEVLWAKELALLFGSTALAQTLVLAAFLGGLSAGNAWLGPRSDNSSKPWRFYALLEAGIALLAVAAPVMLPALGGGGRWLAAACVLLPATLMGGTIPALCRMAGGDIQSAVGRVYFTNSAGAVFGCLLAAFCLVPVLGLGGAFRAAGLINAAVAVAAWNFKGGAAVVQKAQRADRGHAFVLPSGLVHGAVFLSGFVALTYEVAWTRLLALVMGSSVYSFSEMLAAFIAGISLGSLLVCAGPLRRRDPALSLGLAEFAAGIAVLLTLPFCARLPFYFVLLRARLPDTTAAFYEFEAVKFALCFGLMLVPAVCLGATLPLAARLVQKDSDSVGADVGTVFAYNTAGNVLGAFFGLWWLPWLGIEGVIRSGTTVHLAVGAAILWAVLPWAPRRKMAAAAACLVAVIGLRLGTPRWDLRLLSLGIFRSRVVSPPRWFAAFEEQFKDVGMPFYRDDREATVSVLHYGTGEVSLKVNGKTDASTGDDMRTQIYLGELPLLLKPQARDVLLVGWGAGVTAGSILRHPVERLDAVELIPAVVSASRLFRGENRDALDDPRLDLRVEDAKTFLRRATRRYDVIISEPSNPWMAGVGSLFSAEFYKEAHSRLAPGGIMAQWFHLYEMDDELFRIALRTYRSAFPYVTVWNNVDSDVILIGSDRPLRPDFPAMERAFLTPLVWQDLRRAQITFLSTLLGLQSASPEAVASMVADGPLNEDNRPLLEYGAPKAFFRGDRVRVLGAFDDRADEAGSRRLLLEAYLKSRGRPMDQHEYMDRMLFPHSIYEESILRRLIAGWRKRYPRDTKAAFASGLLESYMKRWKEKAAALGTLRSAQE